MTEYLAMVFYGYSDYICYGTGFLILLVLYAIFKGGGLKKPKKEEIWGWVKFLLEKWRERNGRN